MLKEVVQMSNVMSLMSALDKGLFLNNLYEMIRICNQLDKNAPLPFYVLESILSDIARSWDGQAVSVEEVKLAETKLIKPMKHVLDLIKEKASDKDLYRALEQVVSGYLSYGKTK